MKILICLAISLVSVSSFANCESKLKSRMRRHFQQIGKNVAYENIKIAHQQKMEIEQGAYINEKNLYNIEILGETVESFSGLTRNDGVDCTIEYVQRNPTSLSL